MLMGMLIMVIAFWMYTIAIALVRVRSIILERERHTEWVKYAVA
jgi:heme exporter protein C